METVYLGLETTGPDPEKHGVLGIALVDHGGRVIISEQIPPPASHDGAVDTDLAALMPRVKTAVSRKRVITYGTERNALFLPDVPCWATYFYCAMVRFTEYRRVPNEYQGGWQPHSLAVATKQVGFTWPVRQPHALTASMACRAIWQYLEQHHDHPRWSQEAAL